MGHVTRPGQSHLLFYNNMETGRVFVKQQCSLISKSEHYSSIYKNAISPGSSLANL